MEVTNLCSPFGNFAWITSKLRSDPDEAQRKRLATKRATWLQAQKEQHETKRTSEKKKKNNKTEDRVIWDQQKLKTLHHLL